MSCVISPIRYTAAKPKGPVLENTISSAVAAPTDKRGFVMPKFSASAYLRSIPMVLGQMGLPARMVARLSSCFQHLPHPLRLKTQTVASLSRSGAMTMTAITARKSAPTTPCKGCNALYIDRAPTDVFDRMAENSREDKRRACTLVPDAAKPCMKGKANTVPADRVVHLLGAHNACGLASAYLEKGNFTAARRKLVQALASVNQLQAEV